MLVYKIIVIVHGGGGVAGKWHIWDKRAENGQGFALPHKINKNQRKPMPTKPNTINLISKTL